MGAEPTDTENQLYFFHLVVCPREEDNFLFISMSITLTSLYYLGTETYLRHSFSASTFPCDHLACTFYNLNVSLHVHLNVVIIQELRKV